MSAGGILKSTRICLADNEDDALAASYHYTEGTEENNVAEIRLSIYGYSKHAGKYLKSLP